MAMMFVGTHNLLTQTMYYRWSEKQKMTFCVILAHFSQTNSVSSCRISHSLLQDTKIVS